MKSSKILFVCFLSLFFFGISQQVKAQSKTKTKLNPKEVIATYFVEKVVEKAIDKVNKQMEENRKRNQKAKEDIRSIREKAAIKRINKMGRIDTGAKGKRESKRIGANGRSVED